MLLNNSAPDFSLFDTEKKKVTLSELKGKNVLLLFFPLAFTSTCTAELCSMRDNLAFYNSMNAQVLGISIDSLFVLAKFKEEQRINFPLLSDFNKEASKSFGCLYETFIHEMRGVSKRSAFVIGKEGIIRYEEILEKAGDLPNFEAINTVLKDLN
ncbi:MAG: redoxin domain-containing protein [Bacteroidota bacterium]|nr:redoxin domain-containing protein [Bacteroidota bacterium]